MTDRKVLIAHTFHRFVSEAGKPDRRETYLAGQTVTASQAEADEWIAKGLATATASAPISKPKSEPAPA